MKAKVKPNKIVVLSGSGVSAESGLPTFRDAKGLWNSYSWQELASPEGWQRHPEAVLAFYNERREKAWQAQPNAAHAAIDENRVEIEAVLLKQSGFLGDPVNNGRIRGVRDVSDVALGLDGACRSQALDHDRGDDQNGQGKLHKASSLYDGRVGTEPLYINNVTRTRGVATSIVATAWR